MPDEASIAESLPEQDILIQSVCETMVPKLVAEDIPLLFSLLNDVFPNVGYTRAEMTGKFSKTKPLVERLNFENISKGKTRYKCDIHLFSESVKTTYIKALSLKEMKYQWRSIVVSMQKY